MPELKSITAIGFKSIASIENLSLGPVNIVIGSNGSGKSNFLGIFAFLHAIGEGRLQNYVLQAGGADKILHFGAKTSSRIVIEITFQESLRHYLISLAANANDQLYLRNEMMSFEDNSYPTASLLSRESEAAISNRYNERTSYIRNRLIQWRLYHVHDTSNSSPMKKTADLHDNRFLRSDGSNLASFLYYLRLKHEASYDLIRRTVQGVAPFFDDFVLEPQKLNAEKILMEWRHKGSDQYFSASSLSDGTLRFIALATLFLQPEEYRPSVILVDEPELGLHPTAVTLLASMIRSVSKKTQVIVATQSPQLLDHFEPEEVLVADRVNGGTRLTRLVKDDLKDWLEDYSLGQLWEKNELEGMPVPG